jgi:hypothetical protein
LGRERPVAFELPPFTFSLTIFQICNRERLLFKSLRISAKFNDRQQCERSGHWAKKLYQAALGRYA